MTTWKHNNIKLFLLCSIKKSKAFFTQSLKLLINIRLLIWNEKKLKLYLCLLIFSFWALDSLCNLYMIIQDKSFIKFLLSFYITHRYGVEIISSSLLKLLCMQLSKISLTLFKTKIKSQNTSFYGYLISNI